MFLLCSDHVAFLYEKQRKQIHGSFVPHINQIKCFFRMAIQFRESLYVLYVREIMVMYVLVIGFVI